uniref:Uncharacterized protein n=1 Tax=Romanomermis culicivorax TaxID=13658 RepID=A0A915J207_ROMCU
MINLVRAGFEELVVEIIEPTLFKMLRNQNVDWSTQRHTSSVEVIVPEWAATILKMKMPSGRRKCCTKRRRCLRSFNGSGGVSDNSKHLCMKSIRNTGTNRVNK